MQSDDTPAAATRGRTASLLLPALLAAILLAVLFPLPAPAIRSPHPFRVELLLSLFLIALLVFVWRKRTQMTGRDDRLVLTISAAFGLFVVWSGVSVVWGSAFGSVAHHTLLWFVYLVFFLIFTSLIRTDVRFVTTTLVLVSLILGILSIFDYLTIPDFWAVEMALRVRYAKYAEMLVTLSPILCAAAIYARKHRVILFLAAGLSWTTVMLSLSKGAFIAGIIGFAIFLACSALFSQRGFRKRIVASATVWLLLTAAVQIGFPALLGLPSTMKYISGSADPHRTSSQVRRFIWQIGGQMAADNSIIGVGADNFGLDLNHARARFREKSPEEPKTEIAEDYLLERAHNEPLQVLTELGLIGLVLFILPFASFAIFCVLGFRQKRLRFSPFFWAAGAGMTAFLVSSVFSSFSFRSAQNGVVFFMVLAVAVNELGKLSGRSKGKTGSEPLFSRPVYIMSWIFTLLLAVFCGSRAIAEYQVYRAENTESYSIAERHFQIALAIDPEYAGAYLSNAARANAAGYHSEAAVLTRKAIDYGIGTSLVYSRLAKRQLAAQNPASAEATFREALAIYPRSVFIRTEYIVFLESQGRLVEAREQAAAARGIDLRQANGWYAIIQDGSVNAFHKSRQDSDTAAPAELNPGDAVRQYLDESDQN